MWVNRNLLLYPYLKKNFLAARLRVREKENLPKSCWRLKSELKPFQEFQLLALKLANFFPRASEARLWQRRPPLLCDSLKRLTSGISQQGLAAHSHQLGTTAVINIDRSKKNPKQNKKKKYSWRENLISLNAFNFISSSCQIQTLEISRSFSFLRRHV